VSREQVVEGTFCFFKRERPAANTGCCCKRPARAPACRRNLAIVWLIEPREQAQQGGLANAVGADEPDTLAGVQLKSRVLEEGAFVKAAAHVGNNLAAALRVSVHSLRVICRLRFRAR